jgi:glycyl-tRNA synthetase
MASTTSTTTPTMMSTDDLDALHASITKQASLVRQLKQDGSDTTEAVAHLQALKLQAAAVAPSSDSAFNRKSFDDLVIRKMFVVPSFEIHGGVKGLFDLGPPACALKVSR